MDVSIIATDENILDQDQDPIMRFRELPFRTKREWLKHTKNKVLMEHILSFIQVEYRRSLAMNTNAMGNILHTLSLSRDDKTRENVAANTNACEKTLNKMLKDPSLRVRKLARETLTRKLSGIEEQAISGIRGKPTRFIFDSSKILETKIDQSKIVMTVKNHEGKIFKGEIEIPSGMNTKNIHRELEKHYFIYYGDGRICATSKEIVHNLQEPDL